MTLLEEIQNTKRHERIATERPMSADQFLGIASTLAPEPYIGDTYYFDLVFHQYDSQSQDYSTVYETYVVMVNSRGDFTFIPEERYKDGIDTGLKYTYGDVTGDTPDFSIPSLIIPAACEWRPFEKASTAQFLDYEKKISMLNHYYNQVGNQMDKHPNWGMTTIQSRVDIATMVGEGVEGNQLAPISRHLRETIGIYDAYGMMITKNTAYLPAETPGRTVVLTPSRAYIYDINFPDEYIDENHEHRRGAFETYDAAGSVLTLAQAVTSRNAYIGPDGSLLHATSGMDANGRRVIHINQVVEGISTPVMFGTHDELIEQGYLPVYPRMDLRHLSLLRNNFLAAEKTRARDAMPKIFTHNGYIPADISEDPLRNLPEVTGALDEEKNTLLKGTKGRVRIAGVTYGDLLTPSGALAGAVAGRIVVLIGEKSVVFETVHYGDTSVVSGYYPLSGATKTELINARLALDNEDFAIVNQPLLGAVRSTNTQGDTGIFIKQYNPYSGAEVLFPEAALALPYQDVFINISAPSPYIEGTRLGDVASTQLALRHNESSLAIDILYGVIRREDYGEITDAEFSALSKAFKIHEVGLHETPGLADEDVAPYVLLRNNTMEKGQTRRGITYLTTALVRVAHIFGSDLTAQAQKNLKVDFENLLIIFGEDGVPKRFASPIPQNGIGLAENIEQRTKKEQWGQPLHEFSLLIQSENSTRVPVVCVVQSEGLPQLYWVENNQRVKVPNYYIYLHTVTQCLISADKTLEESKIVETLQISSTRKGFLVQKGDIIFTDFTEDAQDSFTVVGEHILRESISGQKRIISKVVDGVAVALQEFDQSDIELEFMYRYLKGEINIVAESETSPATYALIPEAQQKFRSLRFPQLRSDWVIIKELARREFLRRAIIESSTILMKQYEIDDSRLPSKLIARYLELHPAEPDTEIPNGNIFKFDIDKNGIVTLDFHVMDCIGAEQAYTERIVIDLYGKTCVQQYEYIQQVSKNRTETSYPVEESQFMEYLAKQLFISLDLSMDVLDIEKAYALYHNHDARVWIHNKSGNQYAVRIGKEILIFDFNNPTEVSVIGDAQKYTFGLAFQEENKSSTITKRKATIAEWRIVIREVLQKPAQTTMLFEYGIENSKQATSRVLELQKKYKEINGSLEKAQKSSKLVHAELFPTKDFYKDPNNGFRALTFAAVASLDEMADVAKMIADGSILSSPKLLQIKSYSYIVNTNVPITYPTNSWFVNLINFFRVGRNRHPESSLKHITHAVSAGNVPHIIVGLNKEQPRHHGISAKSKVKEGRMYAIVEIPGKGPRLVTNPYEFVLNDAGGYTQTDKQTNIIEFLGATSNEDLRSYYAEFGEIIAVDAIGKLIQETDDRDKAIILAELLEVDTQKVQKDSLPDTIAELHRRFLRPFPRPGRAAPTVASI